MILDQIVAYKKEFVAAAQRRVPLAELKARTADAAPAPVFEPALRRPSAEAPLRVIAECKRRSPSKGLLRDPYDPVAVAAGYAEAGAAAISVLTDEEFFAGHLDHLRAVRAELPSTPLLRKDFTIGEYQIYEAREAGASAVLLIAGVLDKVQLRDYRELAHGLGLGALTEVHSEREADGAAEAGARVIGINNRNLQTFEVDTSQTERVIRLLRAPGEEFVFVSESGLSAPADLALVRRVGADAVLIGEAFMRQPHPGAALRDLLEQAAEYEADPERGAALAEQARAGSGTA